MRHPPQLASRPMDLTATELHFATVFEAMADAFGDADAVVHGTERMLWSEYDDAAARIAGFLDANGIRTDQKVGLFLYNSNEYLTAQYATFKNRAVPVNVNYRYLDDELAYLLENADVEALFFHDSLADRVARVSDRLPKLRVMVQVPEQAERGTTGLVPGATWWSDAIAADPAPRRTRSADEVYMLFTGGTTGMPKGVMFKMGDFVNRMLGGCYAYRGWTPPASPADILPFARAHADQGARRVSIPACPLMHGTGMWLGAIYAHLLGGSVVTLAGHHFDADHLWRVAEQERADSITIVGDAFARPMLDALDRAAAAHRPFKLDDLRVIQSSGVMWSAEVQNGLLHHLDVRLADSMGSTEAGMARRIVTRGTPIETAVFELLPTSRVFTEDGREVVAGSSEIGKLAAGACVPLGYYKDPEKSAATFPTIAGNRYTVAGDWASVDDRGRVVLLGRGSNCINTGGEKVFPEEVEEAMKRLPDVEDCLVVGVPDPRFGERVVAVVALRPESAASGDALMAELRGRISSYKAPRTVHVVERIARAANGKADYAWARSVAIP